MIRNSFYSLDFFLQCIVCDFFFCILVIFKGVISAKMVKIIKFLFFAQKVSSGMGALRPKFLGG